MTFKQFNRFAPFNRFERLERIQRFEPLLLHLAKAPGALIENRSVFLAP
jgi:hypothetical protein